LVIGHWSLASYIVSGRLPVGEVPHP